MRPSLIATATRAVLIESLAELCYLSLGAWRGKGGVLVQFAVGFKLKEETGHDIVDAEDALIAALKVKTQRPEALIMYVRRQNKRGDTRHPTHGLARERR